MSNYFRLSFRPISWILNGTRSAWVDNQDTPRSSISLWQVHQTILGQTGVTTIEPAFLVAKSWSRPCRLATVPVLSAITSRGATSHVSEPQCGGKTNDVGCMLFEKIQALRPSGRKKSLKYIEDLEATGSTPSQARGGRGQ